MDGPCQDNTASISQVVVGTLDRNKKAGIPATTGIPASKPADYRGNFGLDAQTLYFGHGDPSTQGTRAIVAEARAKR
jgi:hypothetical protein